MTRYVKSKQEVLRERKILFRETVKRKILHIFAFSSRKRCQKAPYIK